MIKMKKHNNHCSTCRLSCGNWSGSNSKLMFNQNPVKVIDAKFQRFISLCLKNYLNLALEKKRKKINLTKQALKLATRGRQILVYI